MPRTLLDPITVPSTGLDLYAAGSTSTTGAGNGFQFPYGDDMMLWLRNADTVSRNVTLKTIPGPDGLLITDPVVALNSGALYFFSFPKNAFKQPDGMVYVEIDNTLITAKVYRV